LKPIATSAKKRWWLIFAPRAKIIVIKIIGVIEPDKKKITANIFVILA